MGIHSATDTEYDWPWYGRLAGAWFNGHPNNPNVRKATYRVLDKSHPSTEGFPDTLVARGRVLQLQVDRSDHPRAHRHRREELRGRRRTAPTIPMSWYHDFDGGRAWYTNMGHTEATFSEPLFLRAPPRRIALRDGHAAVDFSRARPEENRFTKVVLAEKLDEPVELAVLPGERVLFIERHGGVNLYTPANGRVTTDRDDSRQHEVRGQQSGGGRTARPRRRSALRDERLGLHVLLAGRTRAEERARPLSHAGRLARPRLEEDPPRGGDSAPEVLSHRWLDRLRQQGQSLHVHRRQLESLRHAATRRSTSGRAACHGTRRNRRRTPTTCAARSSASIPSPTAPTPSPTAISFRRERRRRDPRSTRWGIAIRIASRSTRTPASSTGATSVPTRNVDSVGRGPRGYDEINQARTRRQLRLAVLRRRQQGVLQDDVYRFGDGDAGSAVRSGAPGQHARPTTPASTSCRRRAARTSGIRTRASPEFPIVGSGGRAAAAGPVFHRDDFRAPRDPSRSTTTGSFSSTSSCATGSWR